MFHRRQKPTVFIKLRDFFWPRAGWQRSTRYILHRVGRLPGTPYTLAAGFACGAAISFTPFVGLHFILGALWAWMIRANIVASAIGTAVGNPWTFPFIWIWTYKLGGWMGADGGAGDGKAEDMDFAGMFGGMVDAALKLDVSHLGTAVWPVWWPMLVGSIPTTAVTWIAFYWALKPVFATYQSRRRHLVKR